MYDNIIYTLQFYLFIYKTLKSASFVQSMISIAFMVAHERQHDRSGRAWAHFVRWRRRAIQSAFTEYEWRKLTQSVSDFFGDELHE